MTDGCPISFETKVLSVRRPMVASSSWTFSVPTVTILVLFDEIMDSTVLPNFLSFEAKNPAVPKPVTIVQWLGGATLEMTFIEGASPPSAVTLELLNEDPNLRALDLDLVAPFGPIVVTPA